MIAGREQAVSLAGRGAGGSPPDIAAIVAEELAALAADAQTLATRLGSGDVVSAVVLASNGLTDLLQIDGLRVAAELPPTLLPGEAITVMVTGFTGDRINLQIVPSPPAGASEPPLAADAPAARTRPAASALTKRGQAAPAAGAARGANVAGRAPGTVAGGALPVPSGGIPAAAAAGTRPAAGTAPPPASVTGASPASVNGTRTAAGAKMPPAPAGGTPSARAGRPAPAAAGPAAPGGLDGGRSTTGAADMARGAAGTPRAAAAGSPRAAEGTSSADTGIAHAVDVRRTPQSLPPVLKTIEARLAAAHVVSAPVGPPALQPRTGSKSSAANGAGQAPPAAPVQRPIIEMRPGSSPAAAPIAPVVPQPRGPAAYTDPSALLRALRLPVTATNVAAARMALESPENLPNAFATLERALANTTDPRLTTLSVLTSFLARLEPRSPVLATQIAAFADHVVIGPEAKLAGLVEHGPPSSEQVVVVRAALDYDLKTQLLALGAERASGEGPPIGAALDRAVAGVVSAVTAVQLNAAATLGPNPDGLAFTLPIALADGFAMAHVRIDRDAPDGHKLPLDGDNFHIAFVLETRHLGTVGIDLMTVGRAVTLSLKTEGAPAQRVFGRALGKLSTRLETLRYRVAKASAVVAPVLAASSESPGRAPARDATRLVDIDA